MAGSLRFWIQRVALDLRAQASPGNGAREDIDHERQGETLMAAHGKDRSGECLVGILRRFAAAPDRPVRWNGFARPRGEDDLPLCNDTCRDVEGRGRDITRGRCGNGQRIRPEDRAEGTERGHAGVAIAQGDPDAAARRRELRVAGRRPEVAGVSHSGSRGPDSSGLLAAELHGEGRDVGAQPVVSVDEGQRRQVDHNLWPRVASRGASSQARQIETEEDEPMRVEAAPVCIDERTCGGPRRLLGGAGCTEDRCRPVVRDLGRNRNLTHPDRDPACS
jgi:hypothetical protein